LRFGIGLIFAKHCRPIGASQIKRRRLLLGLPGLAHVQSVFRHPERELRIRDKFRRIFQNVRRAGGAASSSRLALQMLYFDCANNANK
jgi:hypothetical protein